MPALHSFLLMALVQGSLVFLIAWTVNRLRGRTARSARVAAMAITCAVSAGLLLGGYLLTGGSGALMEGMGLVLALCFANLVGSLLMTILWVSRD